MKPSGFYDVPLPASGSAPLLVAGEYFKIMSAPSFPVNIKASFGELKGLISGQGLEKSPFDSLMITNTGASAQTVRIFVGDENFIDGMTGTVSVGSTVAARDSYTQAAYTITPTAANAISAGTRDYLLLQNKSTSGTVWVNFNSTATVANGLRMTPGAVWESGISCPQGAVSCLGDIASNPDFLIIVGA